MVKAAIVCVDDEDMILDSLAEQLKRRFGQQYEVELAGDAREAVFLCEELMAEGIDIPLIISDQVMPGTSGAELLIQLHQDYPTTLKILLTGQAAAESVGKVVNAGALYRYISKPWDETDFLLTVQEALRSYEKDRQLAEKLSELNQSQQDLHSYLSQLLATLECTADGILVLDNFGKVVQFNQKLIDIWGLSTDVPRHQSDLKFSHIFEKLKSEKLYPTRTGESSNYSNLHTINLDSGKVLECYWQPQQNQGNIVGQVWSFRDITERHKAEAFISHQATHDALTGLPNRMFFDQRLSQELALAKQHETLLAVMFLDLDRFKIVNDTLGHGVGDQLLKAVVGRLKNCVRDRDFISRWGGDEFTMLLPNASTQEDVDAIACRVHKVLKSPFQLDGHSVYIGSSIGIALYPDNGQDAETLLKNADTALYRVKENGRSNHEFYSQSFRTESMERLMLEAHLRNALERDEFLLYYQPRIDATTGQIIHLESLIRWQHPDLGLVPPGKFIPLAEETGLIISIGEWVLKTACAQAKVWQDMEIGIGVGVNLSPLQFQDKSLYRHISKALESAGLEPGVLELEITETAAMQNLEFTQKTLGQLSDMGISLAMDDFGVGYASLRYLQQLPFDTLKVDQSFIRDLNVNPADTVILEAILTLGRGLGLEVVAEGVETEDLKEKLQEMSCQYMQGYWFSRPVPVAAATELLLSAKQPLVAA